MDQTLKEPRVPSLFPNPQKSFPTLVVSRGFPPLSLFLLIINIFSFLLVTPHATAEKDVATPQQISAWNCKFVLLRFWKDISPLQSRHFNYFLKARHFPLDSVQFEHIKSLQIMLIRLGTSGEGIPKKQSKDHDACDRHTTKRLWLQGHQYLDVW